MLTAKTATQLQALAHGAGSHAAAAGVHLPGAGMLLLGAAGLGAAWWAVYRVSLWLHPFRMCRRCGGSGITAGFLPWSRSVCGRCGGRGLVPRLGTKALDMRGRTSR